MSGSIYPPGPKGEFLLGSIRIFRNDPLRFVEQNRDLYGDIVHTRFLNRDVYQINQPDYIQQVLVRQASNFHKSPMLKKATSIALGNGLLNSEGEFHKRQRKLAQPAFHQQRIARYADVMVSYTQQALENWHTGDQRDIHHEMMKLTMEIVAKTLFDADIRESADNIGEAITTAIELSSMNLSRPFAPPSWVPTPANRRRANAVAVIDSKVQSMINQRRATGEDKGDLLSMLLLSENEEDGTRMNDKQVRDEAMTLFLAGHETTANALSWALYLIAQHPEVEAKLIEEVDRVLGRRAATVSDLRQLTYTDMVIKEAMRLYPPAWIFTRMALEDFELGMYTIPKGSIILMSPYAMHRHPDYWEHPTEFQPERFHAGWENEVPKYAYVPFGGGPRICIGNSFATMEANLVLATIMQYSTLSLVPNRTTTPEPLITLRPNPGIDMQIKLREAVPA